MSAQAKDKDLGSGGDELELTRAVSSQQAQHGCGEEVERLAADAAGHELLVGEARAQAVEASQLLDEARGEAVDGIVLAAVECTWRGWGW